MKKIQLKKKQSKKIQLKKRIQLKGQSTIKIQVFKGEDATITEVDVIEKSSCNTYALHKQHNALSFQGKYCITHIPTGLRILECDSIEKGEVGLNLLANSAPCAGKDWPMKPYVRNRAHVMPGFGMMQKAADKIVKLWRSK